MNESPTPMSENPGNEAEVIQDNLAASKAAEGEKRGGFLSNIFGGIKNRALQPKAQEPMANPALPVDFDLPGADSENKEV